MIKYEIYVTDLSKQFGMIDKLYKYNNFIIFKSEKNNSFYREIKLHRNFEKGFSLIPNYIGFKIKKRYK